MDILESFDCVQHIDKPTHNSGHLLDYIITRKDSSGVSNLYVSDFINDHRHNHLYTQAAKLHTRICTGWAESILLYTQAPKLTHTHIAYPAE